MRFWLAAGIAAACGFVSLSYEILWYRVFSFVTWGQATSFGLLLAFYLAGVASGASRVRALCASTAPADDASRLATLALVLVLSNLAGFLVIPAISYLAPLNPLLGLGFVAIGAGGLGAILPLACHYGIAPDDRAGAHLSYVYLANIIGSAAGSFLTGFVLMDVASTRTLSSALLVVTLAFAVALLVVSRPPRRSLARVGSAIAATLLVAFGLGPLLFRGLYERLLFQKYDAPPLAAIVENRHGVIVVDQKGQVFGGGAYDGAFNTSLDGDINVVERALAVGALHPAPRDLLMIGLASGSWAQVLANLPGTQHLTIVEINPGYLELIARQPAVASLLQNPKVEIAIDDGRRWLKRHPERTFDVLVMNTTWHWRSSVTNLLSREFQEQVRGQLNPGGIFYFNTTGSPEAQRTGALTFPHALRVLNFLAVSDAPLSFDEDRWQSTLESARVDGALILDPQGPRYAALAGRLTQLGHTYRSEPDGYSLEKRDSLLQRTSQAGVITDDNMLPEFMHPLTFPRGPKNLD